MDHTTLRKSTNGQPDTAPKNLPGSSLDRRWWSLKGEHCCESVKSTVELLQKAQTARILQASISMRLYGNFAVFGAAGAAVARAQTGQSQHAARNRVTYNATQSIIDTVYSKVGEIKPRPYFLTSGGSYQQQRKAKTLNEFEEGNFYENHTYDLGGSAFRDGAIVGDGLVHAFVRGKKIRHECVMSAELWVDEEEAKYGAPRNMHRVKDVDKDELAGLFWEQRDVILAATKNARGASNTISDLVTVVESWHLGAEGEDGKLTGGMHCISLVSEGVMLQEPMDWPHPFFPFARIPWSPRPTGTGYWSQGLAEQLQGDQIELNAELLLIQRSMKLAGSVKVFLKNGSKVVKESVNNEVGGIVNYTGEPPSYQTPQPLHPQYLENPDRIIARMYQKAGVSELSASGKKPMGLDSGAAQREFEDIQSDRFRTTQRYNDNLYLGIAALDIALAMEMKSVDSVRAPSRSGFREVNLRKSVGSLKDSEFILQCFPVSRLPKDPSGRLQTVTEFIQAGIINQRHGRRLLDFPDVDSIETLANAQEDIITQTLDRILDDGDYRPPEPTDDLAMCKEMVLQYLQKARTYDDIEPEKLDLLRKWSQQVDMLTKRAMPPAPMGPPAGAPSAQGGTQAVPAAPPVSSLLPQ